MQTLEQSELNDTEFEEPKISGFDAGNRSILKEPTLYLSIFGLFIISALALINTPTLFWTVFLSLSAIAVIFHILAERYIFSTKKENEKFSAPYEGLFVVTFGSLLPGISLLAYSLFSLFSSAHSNYLSELGKIILLLIVPAINLAVWFSIRRRYLKRPRLVGMMNGISLGLSLSWTIIWLKTCFFSTAAASCKFGWMFLLCVSPFLLLAAILLELDLCRKTEPRIARITGAFSIIGAVLSLLFVFTPTVHTLVVQAALQDAKKAAPGDLEKSISYIQSIATQEDLRPSEYPVSGFGLGGMLIPDRGLESGQQPDKELFFKITGAPYHEVGQKPYNAQTWKPEELKNVSALIGSPISGLSLAKSEINGSIDARTMSASVDWTFTFYNASGTTLESRAEIALPHGAVVSRATLWLDNQPQEGALVPSHIQDPKYRTPVLVTMSENDKIMLKCVQVPPDGGKRKLRITFKLPLSTNNGNRSLRLPTLIESNFAQTPRIHVHLVSRDRFISTRSGIMTRNKNGYEFDEIIKNVNPAEAPSCVVSVDGARDTNEIAIQDWHSQAKQYIVQRLEEVRTCGPKRLVLVVDSSELMKPYIPELKKVVSGIPARLGTSVYFAGVSEQGKKISSQSSGAAQGNLDPAYFGGGQDNSNVLREALETAAEKPDSAVVWIHGPQPLGKDAIETCPLDLVHNIRLYDFEVQAGPNAIIKSLGLGNGQSANGCIYKSVKRASTVEKDLSALLAGWNTSTTSTRISRSLCSTHPRSEIISDSSLSDQVTCLWARDEVARLAEDGQAKQAEALALKYHIVTPISELAVGFAAAKIIDPEFAKDQPTRRFTYIGNTAIETKAALEKPTIGGQTIEPAVQPSVIQRGYRNDGGLLVGAPVDPRYGQSNEVGQLADYGYDSARDLSRLLTALAALVSIFICFSLMCKRTEKGTPRLSIIKGVALAFAIPTAVHLVGTFMINNFGGLGGGL